MRWWGKWMRYHYLPLAFAKLTSFQSAIVKVSQIVGWMVPVMKNVNRELVVEEGVTVKSNVRGGGPDVARTTDSAFLNLWRWPFVTAPNCYYWALHSFFTWLKETAVESCEDTELSGLVGDSKLKPLPMLLRKPFWIVRCIWGLLSWSGLCRVE